MDTSQSISIQEEGSTSSKFVIHSVNWKDALSGKKSIHMASWGKFWNVVKNIVNMKGAEKDHKNPASKPGQMYLLPKNFRIFIMVPFAL
jgi:hypothetical protein